MTIMCLEQLQGMIIISSVVVVSKLMLAAVYAVVATDTTVEYR